MRIHPVLATIAFSIVISGVVRAAEFSGVPVTLQMVPNDILKPIPIDITTDQFKARLKQGGTLTIDGGELVLGNVDTSKQAIVFMALDRLELKQGAKIVTNGNIVMIFANTVSTDNGSVVSFEREHLKSSKGPESSGAGASGNAGLPGLSGGVFSLHVVQTIEGALKVDLRGQDGGDGSEGQRGGTPPAAGRGTDAQDGPLGLLGVGDCKRGGGNGEPGRDGYQGGTAGSGGPGGDGGFFELVNVGTAPITEPFWTFSATGGSPGNPGAQSAGGVGGAGGPGGNGSAYCGGGHGGAGGNTGPKGAIPPSASPGRPGNHAAKNLDLEVMVRTSILVPAASAAAR